MRQVKRPDGYKTEDDNENETGDATRVETGDILQFGK